MLDAHLERALHKREVRVVRHDRFRKGRELHITTAELGDLGDDFLNGSLPAVEDRD